jgi:aldehyde:ferredoxin oxidoreductase
MNKLERKLLAEFKYDLKPVDKGYNRRTLYINLDTYEIKSKPVTVLTST